MIACQGGVWRDVAVDASAQAHCDVRVATWNTWFGAHQFVPRARALLGELADQRPDVIALQEVTPDLLAIILREPWVREYQLSDADLLGYDVLVMARQPVRALATCELPTMMGRRRGAVRSA